MVGETRTAPDLSALYVGEETRTVLIKDIAIILQQRSGDWYMGVVDCCLEEATGKINKQKYAREMITGCVREPKVDYDKLGPSAVAHLLVEIEDFLGISKEAQKKSGPG